MNSLTKIVSEIRENAPIANLALETVNPKVRVGMEGRKNAAKLRIDELKQQFAEEVWNNALFVVPVKASSPDIASDFVTMASEIGGCMPVNYQYWDEKVGTSWWNANDNKPMNIDTIHTVQLMNEIRKTSKELQLEDVNSPQVPRQIFLGSLEDCVAAVKDIVTKSCGAGFRMALLKKLTSDVAEDAWNDNDGQTIPFILTNASSEDVDTLSSVGKKFFTVNLSSVSEVTDEFVQKTLEKIAKANKKNK